MSSCAPLLLPPSALLELSSLPHAAAVNVRASAAATAAPRTDFNTIFSFVMHCVMQLVAETLNISDCQVQRSHIRKWTVNHPSTFVGFRTRVRVRKYLTNPV